MLGSIKKNNLIFIVLTTLFVSLMIGGGYLFLEYQADRAVVDFDSCAKRTNMVLLSYPAQCVHNGKTYTQDIKVNQN
jgi:hypothetical protein